MLQGAQRAHPGEDAMEISGSEDGDEDGADLSEHTNRGSSNVTRAFCNSETDPKTQLLTC